MPIVASHSLHALIRATCAAGGSALEEATLVADQLVEANLTGHDSHGVGLLPVYVRALHHGTLVANRHVEVASDRGAVLVVDGQRGYGQVIGHEAMQLAMARAADQGVALLAIRNSFHLGRIGHWAEQCARGGFASIHFVNGIDHEPLQAPWGGSEARMATNPFAAALPGEGGPAALLDMATSRIALGKARVAANRGAPVPEGSLARCCRPSDRDGNVMFTEPRGAMVAMGDHKGSGLAILCELLAGALTGGLTVQPEHPRAGGIINNMLSVVIDPDALGGREAAAREAGAMIAYIQVVEGARGLRRGSGAGRARAAPARRAARRRDRDRPAQLG